MEMSNNVVIVVRLSYKMVENAAVVFRHAS